MSERKSNYGLSIVGSVVGLVLIYFLSSGPAVWLASQEYVEVETVELIYAPFVWCMQESKTIESLLERWIDLWDGR